MLTAGLILLDIEKIEQMKGTYKRKSRILIDLKTH